MFDELVRVLRRGWTRPLATPTEFEKAADAIEYLVAENERLKREVLKMDYLLRSK